MDDIVMKYPVDGGITKAEQEWLYKFINATPNLYKVVEIGVWGGMGSLIINQALEKKAVPFVHYCVDKFVGSTGGSWWIPFDDSKNKEVRRDDIKQKFLDNMSGRSYRLIEFDSSKAADLFYDLSVDWVWLDAMHTYEKVKDDILAWLPKIKLGGYFSGHDYRGTTKQGVKGAVDEIFGEDAHKFGAIWSIRKEEEFKDESRAYPE